MALLIISINGATDKLSETRGAETGCRSRVHKHGAEAGCRDWVQKQGAEAGCSDSVQKQGPRKETTLFSFLRNAQLGASFKSKTQFFRKSLNACLSFPSRVKLI